MTTALLFILTVICVAMILWGFQRRECMIQFPCLAAVVFTGYLLPQFFGLSRQLHLPSHALDKTIVMSALCLLASFVGYTRNRRPTTLFRNWTFDVHRLEILSLLVTVLGLYCFFRVSQLAPQAIAEHGGQMSGPTTIYLFFAGLLTMGFAIAITLHMRCPSPFTYSTMALAGIMYAHRILVGGRRAAMAQLFIMVLMAFWFRYRWAPPRLAVATVMVAGVLLVNSIGQYRAIMKGDDRYHWSGRGLTDVAQIDFVGNTARKLDSAGSDVINALHRIDAVDRSLTFDYGLSLYDAFINRYVPGQLIGREFKNNLRIGFVDDVRALTTFKSHIGSTFTGMSDSFCSFWYFGALKFALIGIVMSRLFIAGENGNVVAQIVIMLVADDALHAFTHSTHSFFLGFVRLIAFLLPVLLLARSSAGHIRKDIVRSTVSSPSSTGSVADAIDGGQPYAVATVGTKYE